MTARVFRPSEKLPRKLFSLAGFYGLVSFVGIGLFALAIGASEGGAGGALIAIIVTILLTAVWLVPVLVCIPLYYRSIQYEIRDDEIIVRIGIITKSVKHVPFRTVTNLKVSQGPFDRLFGLGTVEVQTAGMSGQTGAEERLIGLADFRETYEEVATAIRRFRGAMGPTQAESEPAASREELLGAILEELRSLRKDLHS